MSWIRDRLLDAYDIAKVAIALHPGVAFWIIVGLAVAAVLF